MGTRREAREIALMILYGLDASGLTPDTAIARFFESFDSPSAADVAEPHEPMRVPSGPLSPAVREHAIALVEGVVRHLARIDAEIQRISTHWRLDRMARVDRNLLRLGVYELLELGAEVPRKVAINEAVEIAKRFGTQESSAFINGILDRIKN